MIPFFWSDSLLPFPSQRAACFHYAHTVDKRELTPSMPNPNKMPTFNFKFFTVLIAMQLKTRIKKTR